MFDVLAKLDWINVIAGFILGLSPIYITAGYNVYKLLRNPLRKKYCGKFWIYHWSLIDSGVIREKCIEINLAPLRGNLQIRIPKDPVTSLAYRGRILRSQGSVLYLLLHGDGNNENILFVINDPLNPDFELTNGVFATVDMRTAPTAGKILLSRIRFDVKEAAKYLEDSREIRALPMILASGVIKSQSTRQISSS